ncbi:hypothetical protein ACIBFB_22680 [Nocardiopsis sp. NPDC050513]|uniref:hypothetical protein n=1 Tax=Nocardiopsis sp. NPDC050513 TaxID=3364338 RepID=UPI0037A65E53
MKKHRTTKSNVGMWLPVGLCMGVAFGAAMDNLAAGIAIGLAFGLGLTTFQTRRSRPQD